MKNIDLNPGGIIGGFIGAGVGAALLIALKDEISEGRLAKLIVPAIVLGAIGGNLLWSATVGQREPPRNYVERRPRQDELEDDRPGPTRKRVDRMAQRDEFEDHRPKRATRSTFRLMLGILGACLGGPIAIALVFSVLNYLEERGSRNWPHVTGEITRFEGKEEREGDQIRYRLWVQYRYTADGLRYSGYTFSPEVETVNQQTLAQLKEQYAPGRSAEVYYSPSQPSKSFLQPGISDLAVYLVVVTFSLLLFAIGMSAFGFWPRPLLQNNGKKSLGGRTVESESMRSDKPSRDLLPSQPLNNRRSHRRHDRRTGRDEVDEADE